MSENGFITNCLKSASDNNNNDTCKTVQSLVRCVAVEGVSVAAISVNVYLQTTRHDERWWSLDCHREFGEQYRQTNRTALHQ